MLPEGQRIGERLNRGDGAGQRLGLFFHSFRFGFINAADLAEDDGRFPGELITGGIGVANALHRTLDLAAFLAVPVHDADGNVDGFFSGA